MEAINSLLLVTDSLQTFIQGVLTAAIVVMIILGVYLIRSARGE